jgi:hypothetical protein
MVTACRVLHCKLVNINVIRFPSGENWEHLLRNNSCRRKIMGLVQCKSLHALFPVGHDCKDTEKDVPGSCLAGMTARI